MSKISFLLIAKTEKEYINNIFKVLYIKAKQEILVQIRRLKAAFTIASKGCQIMHLM